MTRKRLLLIPLFLLLIFTVSAHTTGAQSTPAATTSAASHAKWTLMVYLAANNNLEPNSVINLMEMAAIGSSPDVNIVVQITRPPDYSGFYGDWGGTRRFLITKSDGGISSGDFQISPARFTSYLNVIAAKDGLSAADIDKITKGTAADRESAALAITVPTIEPQTALTPLQIKDVQDLGAQVNSGDGSTLADFGSWAVSHYPADHYGLIMWDHGGGWSMIASDDTLGPAGIAMPSLGKALDTITTKAGQKLDFIGFDACLMAQLPVSVTIEPYADYQIAAEELVPGLGWDYTPIAAALVKNPATAVPDLGKVAVNAFNTLYASTEKDAAQSFDLGVIDLSKVDGVVSALADFDNAVKSAKTDQLKAIATARSNVQQFGSVGETADNTDSIASVDLSDFMRLMSSLSKDSAVQQSAKAVNQAIGQAVLYHKASASLPHANGLSVFFPKDSATFAAADGSTYRTEFGSTLPGWQDFIDTYYGIATGAAATSKVVLQVTKVSTTDQNPGSIYDTPVISYDLNGTSITDVSAYVLYQLDPKTNVVLDTFPITSDTVNADGTQVNDFPDGQSSHDFYWSPTIPDLSDGTNHLLVLMTTNNRDQQHGFIHGVYTDGVTGKQSDASLLINLDTEQPSNLWVTQNAGQPNETVAQIAPKPGDTFEPLYRTIDDKGTVQDQPAGVTLTFSKTPFTVTNKPGPDGAYHILLKATDAAGNSVIDTAAVNVNNTGLDPTLQGYKDLDNGYRFLYPAAWTDVQSVIRADGTVEEDVSNLDGSQTLTILSYTDPTSPAEVVAKAQAEINTIDGVKVGQTTSVQVGSIAGTSIAYQYTDTTGATILGTAIAVYVPDTKLSVVLLFETPGDQATAAAPVLVQILKSFQFFAPPQ